MPEIEVELFNAIFRQCNFNAGVIQLIGDILRIYNKESHFADVIQKLQFTLRTLEKFKIKLRFYFRRNN